MGLFSFFRKKSAEKVEVKVTVDLMSVASYIYNRYKRETGDVIDEIKLQKLMYLSQRESLVQDNVPLFDAVFYGWRFGPVLKEVHAAYKEGAFYTDISEDVISRILQIMNIVFEEYAQKDSMSLVLLCCRDISWKNSRAGIPPAGNSDNPMSLDDLRQDAERIRERKGR